MKKVLILSYDFPPYVSVGGLRPYSWYKYLHESGVYPVVITRQWNNKYGNHLDYIAPSDSTETIVEEKTSGTIIRTPYFPNLANKLMLRYGDSKFRILRKTISAYYEFAQFLFDVGPKAPLYFCAKEYIKNNQVDLIIATGDPFILFNYASKLSKTFNLPWIADYRDPWSQKLAIQKNFILKSWHSHFEKKIVETASLITTVSFFFQIKISSLVKNKKFHILPNGYDPESLIDIKNITQQGIIFSIAFVGSIYNWHPLRNFFSVISNFVRDKKDAKLMINFYGINKATQLKKLLSEDFQDLSKHITIYPKIPNSILLPKLAKENIMLLFNDYSIAGTKIFDYIGIKRTILLCYSNDEEANKLRTKYFPYKEADGKNDHLQKDIIEETNSGYVIQNDQHLRTILEKLYEEFVRNGNIQCNTINAENYSRKHQIKQLAQIIKDLSDSKKQQQDLITCQTK